MRPLRAATRGFGFVGVGGADVERAAVGTTEGAGERVATGCISSRTSPPSATRTQRSVSGTRDPHRALGVEADAVGSAPIGECANTRRFESVPSAAM